MSNKIYRIGDLHGAHQPIKAFMERHNDFNFDETDTIICLGDVGTNFYMNKRDWKFKHNLCKMPFTYFMIRGNHEERASAVMEKHPAEWHIEKYFGNQVLVENEFPQIKYALDRPTHYNIGGYKAFVFPGAYSVDKYYRLQSGWSWFPNEQLNETEMQSGLDMCERFAYKCDIVLSHTCPVIYEPTDLFLSCVDQSMVDKTMEQYLGSIEYQLDYKAWFWGHYHAFRNYPMVDGKKKLMLFNQELVELHDYVEGSEYIL